MADLGNLVVKIEADVSQLKNSLSTANTTVKDFADKTNKSVQLIGDVFKFVFAERVVHEIVEALNKTIEYGKELEKLSITANVAAGQIAKLQYAFEQEGGSASDLNRILPILAKNIAEGAKGGNDMASAFNKLGIDLRDSQGNLKNVSSVFTELVTKVGSMDDKTKALAITMQILGRGGKEAFELFSKGGENLKRLMEEFDSFGLAEEKITKFAHASKEFEDAWHKIEVQMNLAKIAMLDEVLPALIELANTISKFDWVGFGDKIGVLVSWLIKAQGISFEGLELALKIITAIADKIDQIQSSVNQSPFLRNIFQVAGPAGGNQPGTLGQLQSGIGPMQSGFGVGGSGSAGANMMPETVVTADKPGGEERSQKTGIAGMIQAIQEMPKELEAAAKKIQPTLKKLDDAFKALGSGIEKTFENSFKAMMDGSKSFSESLTEGFKSVAIDFAAMIATMILKWTAFFLAVMAIALTLAAFGVPIGATFRAAFAFVGGGGTADAGSATSAVAGVGKKILGGFLGFRSGGALMARNGLMTAQTGIALTGSLGEGGIPVIAHPNEIIAPIDKVFDFMAKGTFGGGMTVNINGANQDPRQLAESIMIEIDRKRRNPF